MAIDSASKRRSAAGVGRPWRAPGLTPDALQPAAWRAQAGRGYSGIPAGLGMVGYPSALPEVGTITLALFDESRSARLDVALNRRLVAIDVKTAINRGYQEARIGIRPDQVTRDGAAVYGEIPRPIDLRAFTRAELWIGTFLVFEGRVGPANQPTTQMVIQGHARELFTDDWYASTDSTAVTSGELLKSVLAASYVNIKPAGYARFVDPLSSHAPAEFDGRVIGDILTLITNEGDQLGNEVDWFVWENRRLWLQPRVEPKMPHYTYPFDPRYVLIQSDPSEIASRLTIEFDARASGTATITSGSTSVVVTHGLGVTPDAADFRINQTADTTNDTGNWWIDTIDSSDFTLNVPNDPGAGGATYTWVVEAGTQRTSEASKPSTERDLGRVVRRKIPAGGMTLAAAERIRDQLLKTNSRPRYSVRVTLMADRRPFLRGPHGEPAEIWRVRAGEWIKIGNLPPLVIVETSADLTGRKTVIEAGDPLPTLRDQLARLRQSESRRQRRIDPTTGGSI